MQARGLRYNPVILGGVDALRFSILLGHAARRTLQRDYRVPEMFRLAIPLRRYCGITVVGSDVTLSNTEP